MYQDKSRMARKIEYLKAEIENWKMFKALPIDDLCTRAIEAQDFVSVVSKLVKNSQIISSYHWGKCQQGVYLLDDGNNLTHIGYKSGKDYLLDSDLVYRSAMKLTRKRFGFYAKTKGVYFTQLLCDRVIKPHWRHYYKFSDGQSRRCICIPNTSLHSGFESYPLPE